MLGRLIPGVQKNIARLSKKTKMTLIASTVMRLPTRIKKRLSPITTLPLISLKPRPSKKHQRSWQRGFLAIGVNAIKIAKNDKDNAKNLSHVKCYTSKQKDNYVSKYPKKPKN